MMSEGPNMPTTRAVPSSGSTESNLTASWAVFTSACGTPFFHAATAVNVNVQSNAFTAASRARAGWALIVGARDDARNAVQIAAAFQDVIGKPPPRSGIGPENSVS